MNAPPRPCSHMAYDPAVPRAAWLQEEGGIEEARELLVAGVRGVDLSDGTSLALLLVWIVLVAAEIDAFEAAAVGDDEVDVVAGARRPQRGKNGRRRIRTDGEDIDTHLLHHQ